MTRDEIFAKLESVTETMERAELLALIRDFGNYLNAQDLKDCLECNGYVDFPDDGDDEDEHGDDEDEIPLQ